VIAVLGSRPTRAAGVQGQGGRAGDPTGFERADVVDQAAVLEAVGRSAATGFPVELPLGSRAGFVVGHPPGPLAGPSDPD
jgi:hypothetical protein